jgi:hypothetical protein
MNRMMYPSPVTHSNPPRNMFPFEKRPGFYDEMPPLAGIRQIDLPRPIEPRPDHQAHANLHTVRHADANTVHNANGYRPSNQTLPGVRDLLISDSHLSPRPLHSPWGSTSVSTPQQPLLHGQRGHNRTYSQTGSSQPPPRVQPSAGCYSPHDRRVELPILETQPMQPAPPSHSRPLSPYVQHQDGREHVDARHDRHRQASTSSYMTASASVPSPYTPLTSDDSIQKSSTSLYDRACIPPLTPTGPETSKKYLGTQEVNGTNYHVYEGGYRVPTQVDGDAVNPLWGLTKANKPRKRLALACLDCREKKIKCEPGAASCVQCEKAKRQCRR